MERACKSMALDLSAHKIRVNCVAPGAVWKRDKQGNIPETPFLKESVPLSRSGYVEDIGEACAFLADERSSYITGTTLLVDGGLILPGMMEHDVTPWKQPNWTPRHKERAMEMLKKSQEEK
jgi:NAD(P)-dependent dehydrogenase (short-subunit alcohol dehydrogenase family)